MYPKNNLNSSRSIRLTWLTNIKTVPSLESVHAQERRAHVKFVREYFRAGNNLVSKNISSDMPPVHVNVINDSIEIKD